MNENMMINSYTLILGLWAELQEAKAKNIHLLRTIEELKNGDTGQRSSSSDGRADQAVPQAVGQQP